MKKTLAMALVMMMAATVFAAEVTPAKAPADKAAVKVEAAKEVKAVKVVKAKKAKVAKAVKAEAKTEVKPEATK